MIEKIIPLRIASFPWNGLLIPPVLLWYRKSINEPKNIERRTVLATKSGPYIIDELYASKKIITLSIKKEKKL